MAPQSFLFVNKSSKSDSLSNSRGDRAARIRIHQHAGSNASRRKCRQRTHTQEDSVKGQQDSTPNHSIRTSKTGTNEVDTSEEDVWRQSSHDTAARTSTSQVQSPMNTVERNKAQSWISNLPLSVTSGNSDSLALTPHERQMLYSPRPEAPISPLPNYLANLTPREHRVLQHYASVWMPSQPGHGTLTGLTILSSQDMAFSSFIIQSALQTCNTFSLYAFLTMVAQRMHLTGSLAVEDSSPEYFSVKSVQALRTMVSSPFSEGLVLALANIILGEAYIRNHGSPAVSIYRGMQRGLIMDAGGLFAIRPLTAQIIVAYDFYTSQGTLTIPYFDVYQNPGLLGIDIEKLPVDRDGRHEYIRQTLIAGDSTLRVLLECCHDLSKVISSIARLDSYAIKAVTSLVWSNVPRKLGLNAATLQRASPMETMLSSKQEVDIMAMDSLWMHVRQRLYLVWTWYSALGLSKSISSPAASKSSTMSPSESSVADPTPVARAHAQLWRQLDHIQSQLQHSGWKVSLKTVLLICAVCFLTVTGETEQEAYLQRFGKAAATLDIESEQEMRMILDTMLPLKHLSMNRDAVSHLWSELVKFRGGGVRVETGIGMRNAISRKEEWLGRALILECSKREELAE